jgi:hypothetical protein
MFVLNQGELKPRIATCNKSCIFKESFLTDWIFVIEKIVTAN